MVDEDVIVIQLIVLVVCGAIAAAIASSKGRSGVGWFFCGFFFGLIGIIIIACLSNLNEDRNRRNYVDWQQRRVQEQIYQEQVKNQAFQQYTTGRLDQHDQHLGLNTRPANQNLTYGGGGNPNFLPNQGQAVAGEYQQQVPLQAQPQTQPQGTTWHVIDSNNQQLGPLSAQQVLSLINEQRLTRSSLAFSQQRNTWCPISEIQELAGLFSSQGTPRRGAAPPPPPPRRRT